MTIKVTAYTVRTTVAHGGFSLEIEHRTGINLGARTGRFSWVSVKLVKTEGQVKSSPQQIETPATEESFQPILETLTRLMGEEDGQLLFEKMIVELGEMDAEVLRVEPNIFVKETA